MLAYERKVTAVETPKEETPPPPNVPPPERKKKRSERKQDEALVFYYPDGEKALQAAKDAIKGHPDYRYQRKCLEDGSDCFEVTDGNKALERHIIFTNNDNTVR